MATMATSTGALILEGPRAAAKAALPASPASSAAFPAASSAAPTSPASSQSASKERAADWVWANLFARDPSRKGAACFVPVADVVVFGDGAEAAAEANPRRRKKKSREHGKKVVRVPLRWIYTDDKGKLSYRSGRALSWNRIRDAFQGLAQADSTVCKVTLKNGSTQILDRATFQALLAGAKRDGGLSAVHTLQACIHDGRSDQLRCRTRYSRHDGCETRILGGVPEDSLDFEAALAGICTEFVATLEAASGESVQGLTLEFAADRDGVLRVVDISDVSVSGNFERRDEDYPRARAKSGKSLRRGGPGASRAKHTKSAPSLPALSRRGGPAVKQATPTRSRCGGDFCGIRADRSGSLNVIDVKGLDDAAHMASGPLSHDELQWAMELKRVRAASASRKTREPPAKTAAATLHKIGQRDVMLARHEMHFITGAIRMTDGALREEDDFAQAWKQLDERLQYDLGVKHPDQFYQDTSVCDSCFQVYKKLEGIRTRGFQCAPVHSAEPDSASHNDLAPVDKQESIDPRPTDKDDRHREDEEGVSGPMRQGRKNDGARGGELANKPRPSDKGNRHDEDEEGVSAPMRRGRKNDGARGSELVNKPRPSASMNNKPVRSSSNNVSAEEGPSPSLAETEFLMRHADQLRSDTHARKLQEERRESQETISRLQREVQSRTAQTNALRETLQKTESQLAMHEANVEELTNALRKTQESLSSSQHGFVRAMHEKDEEIRRLALEVERVRHAALAAQSQDDKTDSLSAQLLEAAQAEHRLSRKVDDLVRRVKDLEEENEALSAAGAQTKKAAAREQRAQEELASLRAQVETLSGSSDERSTETRELKHALETQKEKEAELRRQIGQLGADKQKLQVQLDKTRHSLKSITSLGSSEDAAMAAVRATAEAKVQQIKNELDFVRKQAETESGFVHELRAQLADAKRQSAEAAAAHKEESVNLTARLRDELVEREKKFEKELQIPRSQISLLEDKVATLQTSLQKMGNEMAATQRKLQVSEMDLRRAKDETARSEDERLALERNLAELRATLASQQAETEVEDDGASAAGAPDDPDQQGAEGGERSSSADGAAQLRRIQNEVDYLRKQVGVEEKAKGELANAVSTTRAQLRKTIDDWKADVSALQNEHRHALEQVEGEASVLREAKLDADSEVKRLQIQLVEAREGFARAKDQLLVDQRALESSAAAVSQLKEDLADVRQRLTQAHERGERAKAEHAEEARSLRAELEALKANRHEVTGDLKNKLAKAHKQVSASHAAMLELRESTTRQQEANARKSAARIAAVLLRRRARLDTCTAFHRLRTAGVAASLQYAAAEELAGLRQQHEQVLGAELANLEANLTASAQTTLQQHLAAAQAEHETAREVALRDRDEKWQRELAETQGAHREALRAQLEEHCALRDADAKAAREGAQQTVAKLEAAHKAAFQSMVRRAAQERDEAVGAAREELQQQLHCSLEEARAQHSAQLSKLAKKHDAALAQVREKLTKEKDEAVSSMMNSAETDCQCALQALEREMEARIDAIRQELDAQHAAALDVARDEAERDAEARLAAANEAHARKLDEDLAAAREVLEADRRHEEARLAQQHRETVERLNAEHGVALRRLRETHEADLAALRETSMSKLEEAVRRTREEERVERTNALTQSTEKWQRIVQECTEDNIREQERLVAEAAKAKAAAVEKVKLEARAEIAARDAAAAKSRAQLEEAVLQKSRAELEELRGKLEQEHEQQLQAAVEAAGKREEAALLRAQGEKERALRVQRNKAAAQLEETKQEADDEKERALVACAREAATQMAAAVKKERQQASQKLNELRSEMARERQDAETAILEECDRVTDRKLEEAQLQLQEAVLKCRKQCETQFGDELEKVRRERDQLMDDADRGMQAAREERESLQKSLHRSNAALEEAEDLAFDLQSRVQRLEQAGRYFALSRKLEHGRAVAAFCKLRGQMESAAREKQSAAEARGAHLAKRAEQQLERAVLGTKALEASRTRMHKILVGHKREELLQHKVETAVIQDDLKKLQHAREALEKQREQLQRDVTHLENQIRGVEQGLEQLSKGSAIQDGQINVSHAKRKRRLDQEFEHLLDRVAHQRKQIDAVEEQIASVHDEAERKEEALREMEAGIIAVLVEQQKLLLAELVASESKDKPMHASKT